MARAKPLPLYPSRYVLFSIRGTIIRLKAAMHPWPLVSSFMCLGLIHQERINKVLPSVHGVFLARLVRRMLEIAGGVDDRDYERLAFMHGLLLSEKCQVTSRESKIVVSCLLQGQENCNKAEPAGVSSTPAE